MKEETRKIDCCCVNNNIVRVFERKVQNPRDKNNIVRGFKKNP